MGKKQRTPGAEMKSGFKSKVGGKGRQNKLVLTFDDKERQEFLTGFHKRKEERRKAAVEEIKNKLKEEQKRVREERHKEYLRMLKERKEALEEVDDLDDVITSKTECVQYDHPNHTVTVTTISDLDLSGGGLLTPLTNQNQEAGASDEEERRSDEEEPVQALPRKAGNPLLSKKIQSLTASLNTFTKQKRRKGKTNFRQRSQQQGEGKPSAATGNKRRLGKTCKKQRRKRTGNKERSQD